MSRRDALALQILDELLHALGGANHFPVIDRDPAFRIALQQLFAVFVEDGQTGGVPANPIAARFLTALAG